MPLLVDAIFDVLERLGSAADPPSAWSIYMHTAREAGLSFGVGYTFRNGAWEMSNTFANSMPEGWLEHYGARDYGRHSPIVVRNEEPGPFQWRLSDWDGRLTPRQREWRADNIAAGVQAGFNIPERVGGQRNVIALCGGGERVDPKDLIVLRFAGLETLYRMRLLGMRRASSYVSPLSEREAECLTWVAVGKSDWEIGEILQLSEKTVNHHVERAKEKLAVRTRVQAVVIAIREGRIAI